MTPGGKSIGEVCVPEVRWLRYGFISITMGILWYKVLGYPHVCNLSRWVKQIGMGGESVSCSLASRTTGHERGTAEHPWIDLAGHHV